MEIKRESFVFYKSWYAAIKSLPAEVKGEIYTAVIEYCLYGSETHNMGKIANAIFALIRPQADANLARYKNGCKIKKQNDFHYGKQEAKPKQTGS